MGRSVSTPPNAQIICYRDLIPSDDPDGEEADLQWEYEALLEDLQEHIPHLWPSFVPVKNRWIGREDRVILENGHSVITLSEYGGLTALCVVPHNPNDPLAFQWIEQIRPHFEQRFQQLTPIATFSNGEVVYRHIA